jgi:hypothetical protein
MKSQSILFGQQQTRGDRMDKELRTVKEVWDSMPYEHRLAAAAYVFERICEHARDGGTYRCLIYERLGFKMDAYAVLLSAGGMDISNHFSLDEV